MTPQSDLAPLDMREATPERREIVARDLYEAHGPDILRLGYRYSGGDPDRAEELVAETFARVITALPYFRGDSGWKTWIYRIALNVIAGESRRAKEVNREARVAEQELQRGRSPLQEVMDREKQHRVQKALLRLSEDHRMVLSLIAAEGLSHGEVSEILGVPEGTVWSRYARARIAATRILDSIE